MKEKTELELLFLAQDTAKLAEIVDYLIRKEICDGVDNLGYISVITASLVNCTGILLSLVKSMQAQIPESAPDAQSVDTTVE